MKKEREIIHSMAGKLDAKLIGPCTRVEVKESGEYMLKDQYTKIMKNVIPIH